MTKTYERGLWAVAVVIGVAAIVVRVDAQQTGAGSCPVTPEYPPITFVLPDGSTVQGATFDYSPTQRRVVIHSPQKFCDGFEKRLTGQR